MDKLNCMRPDQLLRELQEASKYIQARLDTLEARRLRELSQLTAAYGELLELGKREQK
jgi:hypothetical protein